MVFLQASEVPYADGRAGNPRVLRVGADKRRLAG